jgi:hypothetical protein
MRRQKGKQEEIYPEKYYEREKMAGKKRRK